jgi:HK97 family phage prohead protease
MKVLRIGHKSIDDMYTVSDGRVGKSVSFMHEGRRIVGVYKCATSNGAVIELAIPDSQGVLTRVGSEVIVPVNSLTETKSVVSEKSVQVKAWSASVELKADEKAVALREDPKDDKSVIVDYKDVFIEGFLSTFVKTTPADRVGDYVMPNAFDESLAAFRENPVMLMDHKSSVHEVAGSFVKIGVSDKGLFVRGQVSNAPGLRDLRFKIVEGHIKSLSMGGLLYYMPDGRGIEKVMLYEGSMVACPCNPDAMFQVRSFTVCDAVKMYDKRKDLLPKQDLRE